MKQSPLRINFFLRLIRPRENRGLFSSPSTWSGVMVMAAAWLCGGFAGTCLYGQNAAGVDDGPPQLTAAQRSDSFETKMALLQAAWRDGDLDLARSLTHSLRDTVIQTQHESQSPGESLVPSEQYQSVVDLAAPIARWAEGWQYVKFLTVEETAGERRHGEPVEFLLSFPDAQVTSLAREVRLASLRDGQPVEIPSQVFGEVRRGERRYCRILCMLDSLPRQQQTLLVFYGNPDAELPQYPSDLSTVGEGFALDISNAYFKASLSRQTGQLERLTLLREHGLQLYSGGEGHGEPPGIDWAHDYVDSGHFQKLRISLWDTCPDYEVIRGPLCTIIRRWGFPYSPVHPVYSPSRLHIAVEYRFYSGLPWFHKSGTMKAITDVRAEALRDDEWVFTGQSFTDKLWMNREGRLHTGDVPPGQQQDLWGVGFYNQDTADSFMALFLEHTSQGIPEPLHTGSPTLVYRWHGSLWSRYPLPLKDLPAGASIHQKNAYVALPFHGDEDGARLEQLRRSLVSPLVVAAAASSSASGDAATVRTAPRSDGPPLLTRPPRLA
ncbi:MAG: hypothetical protein KDA45_13175, partial [Planctomycetales bacterium]|nr:hypothetical protein [Planctomycetales bacterium]